MAWGLAAVAAATPVPDPEGALEAVPAPGPEGALGAVPVHLAESSAGAAPAVVAAAEAVAMLVVIRGGRDGCDLGHGDEAGTRRGTNILPSRM